MLLHTQGDAVITACSRASVRPFDSRSASPADSHLHILINTQQLIPSKSCSCKVSWGAWSRVSDDRSQSSN